MKVLEKVRRLCFEFRRPIDELVEEALKMFVEECMGEK